MRVLDSHFLRDGTNQKINLNYEQFTRDIIFLSPVLAGYPCDEDCLHCKQNDCTRS